MNTKKFLFYSFAALLVLSGFLYIGKKPIVHAENTVATAPIVQASNTPNGQMVTITFPEGYNGKVTTTYDGHQFNTVSSPLTAQDVDALHTQFAQQQQYFQQVFADQQKLLDDMWNSFRLDNIL